MQLINIIHEDVKYRKSIGKVSKWYRKVLGIGIGFFGDTDTLKLTRYLILRVPIGIGFVPFLENTTRNVLSNPTHKADIWSAYHACLYCDDIIANNDNAFLIYITSTIYHDN